MDYIRMQPMLYKCLLQLVEVKGQMEQLLL